MPDQAFVFRSCRDAAWIFFTGSAVSLQLRIAGTSSSTKDPEVIMHDPLTLTLTLLSVVLTAAAQICLKVGVGHPVLQLLLADRAWSTFLTHAVLSPWVLLGLLGYVVSTGTWLLVLARADLSAAYPFVSLAFVATSLYGYWALHEPMSPARLSGIVLIVGGMLLVARS